MQLCIRATGINDNNCKILNVLFGLIHVAPSIETTTDEI
jgi:hypothetical protein